MDFEGLGVSKHRFFKEMMEAGIRPQVHYIPVHLQPYYQERYGYKPGDFPSAERFYAAEVSLPIYPLLTDAEVLSVKEAVYAVLGRPGERACGA